MPTQRHTLIAREGWLLIFLAVCVTILICAFAGLGVSLPFAFLVLFLFFLFRDPPRKIPAVALGLVSPVDGTVVAVEEVQDVFLDRQAIRLSLKMNWYGIYIIRSPMEGKVVKQWFNGNPKEVGNSADKIQSKSAPTSVPTLAPTLAPTSAQWIQSDEGDDVIVSMTNDKITRRPGCLTQSGERIGQGQRCGFIHFGAAIELFIPLNSRLEVKKGDKVLAGSDIVATLVHKD
ncbi:MAG: hypothetical protein GXP19_02130 [Gammaproteobacteria bacterium]|nr:hypothetical protein [Gammaproteobacteria bacterium]